MHKLDTDKAQKLIKDQLYKALVEDEKSSRELEWFAPVRFASSQADSRAA